MSISWISFEALSPISRSWNPQQVRQALRPSDWRDLARSRTIISISWPFPDSDLQACGARTDGCKASRFPYHPGHSRECRRGFRACAKHHSWVFRNATATATRSRLYTVKLAAL